MKLADSYDEQVKTIERELMIQDAQLAKWRLLAHVAQGDAVFNIHSDPGPGQWPVTVNGVEVTEADAEEAIKALRAEYDAELFSKLAIYAYHRKKVAK